MKKYNISSQRLKSAITALPKDNQLILILQDELNYWYNGYYRRSNPRKLRRRLRRLKNK